MSEDVIKPLNEVLMSGFITQGPQVEKFEADLKKHLSHDYVLTLNSATSGLTLALRLFNDTDCEVLTTPLTCMATNLPILANNLKIKWVDTDPTNCNINLKDLENKITPTTRIIMFVHWGGNPVDLNELKQILDRTESKFGFRPYVIEDCAHAFGAELDMQFDSIKVFSLQAIKHLTTGDGGLILLPNATLYEKAKLLRWYGIDRDKRNYNKKDLRMENDVIDWGYKFHMNDINAVIGIYNLPHMNRLLEKNRVNASYYDEHLKNVTIMKSSKKSAYWLYTILIDRRDEFIEFMKNKNITCSQVHKRNDVHTCFSEFKTTLPNLDMVESKMVCIPVGWWVENPEYIVECIHEFLQIK
jgi:dTDP-4-amino-4,6-dideoxygalactose transaminase